jgi:hypothetical protein
MTKLFSFLALSLNLAFAYDEPFNNKCLKLYEMGQEKLHIQNKLLELAETETGEKRENLYHFANKSRKDFDTIKQAFKACQNNKPFSLDIESLDSFHRVEIEIVKLLILP